MIEANQETGLMIKESDQYCYHVRLKRIAINPNDPTHPEVSQHIKCFTKTVFEKMEALRNGRNPIVWYRAGGFDEAKVVHDPTLLPPPVVEDLSEAEKLTKADMAEKAKARQQAKRMATLAANKAARLANKT
jgi:hypothetical protein